jgi:DNA-binding transcriptional ArsR family regulator
LSADESKDVLKGTTLEVYRFLLKSNKPVGIRELQRALNLSSPSVATYHLSKLEEAGLLKRQDGGYTVDRFLLENSVKISRFLIPRFLFYAIFAFAVLLIELTLLRPAVLTREYVFFVGATAIFTVAFFYETIKTYQRGSL